MDGHRLHGTIVLPKRNEERRGLYIEYDKDAGSAILLDGNGLAELGDMRSGVGFFLEKSVRRDVSFGKTACFRLLLKDSLLEFYLNDILIECFSLPTPATGRIGLISGGGTKVFGRLKAWR